MDLFNFMYSMKNQRYLEDVMAKPKCKLCRFPRDLRYSHAIPNTYFKFIFRQGNGKGVLVNTEDGIPVISCDDSWASYQLCNDCEKKLNSKYEDYLHKVLTNKGQCTISKTDEGILFENLDTNRIKMCLLSILWRCSESNVDEYKNIQLPDSLSEKIRVSLNSGIEFKDKHLYIDCRRMIDASGHIDKDKLRSVIIQPHHITYDEGAKAWVIGFLGYYFEFFYNIKTTTPRVKSCFLGYNRNSFLFHYLDVMKIPEFIRMGVAAIDKCEKGQ
ncbi:hypothetical protein E2J97_15520, partial [Vibrio cholerae]|nr:hypothetical protein [Vibrio cholerae]HDZ9227079.1 hypothetical protein [Vibrio cholerae]